MPGFKGTAMNAAPDRNPQRFGHIPGFPPGSRWPGRRELCDDGVHAALSSGIHGRSHEGAYSVVLSGGYEDDIDLGYEFTYTGQGGQGRREKGVKWNSAQIADQEWVRGNLALEISRRTKQPVRVIRGHTLKSPYAPEEGYQYDGLYTVVDADKKPGKSGFQVCLFRFVRCPNQPPLSGPIATLPMRRESAYVHSPAPTASSSSLSRESPTISEGSSMRNKSAGAASSSHDAKKKKVNKRATSHKEPHVDMIEMAKQRYYKSLVKQEQSQSHGSGSTSVQRQDKEFHREQHRAPPRPPYRPPQVHKPKTEEVSQRLIYRESLSPSPELPDDTPAAKYKQTLSGLSFKKRQQQT